MPQIVPMMTDKGLIALHAQREDPNTGYDGKPQERIAPV